MPSECARLGVYNGDGADLEYATADGYHGTPPESIALTKGPPRTTPFEPIIPSRVPSGACLGRCACAEPHDLPAAEPGTETSIASAERQLADFARVTVSCVTF